MNIALIGLCETSEKLIEALVARGSMLTAIVDIDDAIIQTRPNLGMARVLPDWEPLVHDGTVEWVIVAGKATSDEEVDRLRKLVQADVGVVLMHPACDAIVSFELDMIRTDTGSPLLALCPGQNHPILKQFHDLLTEETSVGQVEQIRMTRFCTNRDRSFVEMKLATDVALLRQVLGGLDTVSASGPEHGAESFANLSLHLECSDRQPATWVLEPDSRDRSEIVLIGSRGRLVLHIEDDDQWTLTQVSEAGQQQLPVPSYDPFEEFAERLEVDRVETGRDSNWPDACKDADVLDTIDISLRRGRKIALFQETPSQEGTFKGVMAASGCGLLLLVFFVLIIWSLIEGLRYPQNRNQWEATTQNAKQSPSASAEPRPDRYPLLWRIWPIYPLILFLMLQVLRGVAKDARSKDSREAPPESPDANQPDANQPDANQPDANQPE